ncbi:MAG TPA: serine/threonine-protein kinase [Verrucomicrobiae bacterium]|jgi:serine/threonine protein kinase
MSGPKNCPKCNAALPPDAPGGYCARCLLLLGFEIENAAVAMTIEKSGDRIGRYTLLEQIGEGGMGTVWMAEQHHPQRRVAIKLVKIGMDTKQFLARFQAEQQALAMMDHPNIAMVYDAGATDSGRPYFVMELVSGVPITTYCNQEHLTARERLDLFVKVCQGVQHAHQKGVIHRDLKPSNILVTKVDGQAVPKIIDFGIAKAAQGKLVNETFFTALGQFLGTPAYMSPEQADRGALDVDTRSDIYNLGVLLYELLTSQTPFDAKELLAAGLEEMRRTIREKEPLRPSTRLSKLQAADLTSTARQQRMDAPKLVRFLRGDLDCIAMKCLEKERKRRYETVNGLTADIKSFLENKPIAARPPSHLYRFVKLVRRNRLSLSVATLTVLSILLGFYWQQARVMMVHLYYYLGYSEAVIAEVNFQDKQPQYYHSFGYAGKQMLELGNAEEVPGAGPDNPSAMVGTFDTSFFLKHGYENPGSGNTGLYVIVEVPTGSDNWVNTTNLGSYKLYLTAKTTGLAANSSRVKIRWAFTTTDDSLVTVAWGARLTTNYQTFSLNLADGYVDQFTGGNSEWEYFADHLDKVNTLRFSLHIEHWKTDYRPDEPVAVYISNLKFVRLMRPEKADGNTNPSPNVAKPLSSQISHGTNALFGKTNSPSSANLKMSESTIAEINFQDKQPESSEAYSYDGVRGTLAGVPVEEAGAGPFGGNAQVARFDTSIFTNPALAASSAGCGIAVATPANRSSGINTTNLGDYKLYLSAKTTGLAGNLVHGRVQWQFLTPKATILTIDSPVTFTTNYQVYSFVLADGYPDPYSGGSWDDFINHFDEIDKIQCAVIADNWNDEYRLDQPAAFYIGDVKFVRLTPEEKTSKPVLP